MSREGQKHDILISYTCPGQWTVHASPEQRPNRISDIDVDPDTCEPTNTYGLFSSKIQDEINDDIVWQRVKFTLFSMMVSASFFAAYDVTSFYLGVTLIAASQLRPIFLYGTWRGWVYETTHPDAIMKLCEACYIKRHEEDLVGEEECYRMLQEILRSPELLKAIAGSSLKGSCDPQLDGMGRKARAKLEHLEIFERKGFDVADLKKKLLEKNSGKLEELHKM